MKVLYLSSLNSKTRNNNLFKKYKTATSHASQKFHRMLIEGLSENNYDVELLSIIPITKSMDSKIYHTAETEIENHNKFTYISRLNIPMLGQILTILQSVLYIVKWLTKNKDGIIICDGIIGEYTVASLLISKLIRFKKITIVTDVPGYRAHDTKMSKISRCLETLKLFTLKKFDGYIFLTNQMNDLINKNNKPFVVIEGFSDQSMNFVHNSLSSKYEKKVCLMAGSLDKVFGIDLLIAAFIKADVKDAELHLYGKGDYVNLIKEISLKHSSIKYYGEATNEEIILEEVKSTLLINPRSSKDLYTQYSFPSKNIEYMASGTPLLANNLPGMPKEYKGYFIDIEEASELELALKIRNILSKDKEELNELGLKAKKWILSNKNNFKQSEKVISLIDKL